jgi:predicted hydrocarbon binding protein
MRISDVNLILTYFDHIEGPRVFYSIPERLPSKLSEIITELMNLDFPNSFFEVEIQEEIKGKFLNKFIEIPSKRARGNKEQILLTGILPKGVNTLFLEFIFKDFEQKLREYSDVYHAFYAQLETNGNKEIKYKSQYKILTKLLNKTYQTLKNKFSQINFIKRIPTGGIQNNQFSEIPIDKIDKTILKTFITSIDSRIPEGAALLYDIGVIIGDRIHPLFVDTKLDKLLNQLGDFWERNLLGEIDEVEFISNEQLYFNVYECFECSHMPDIGQPVCKFDEGVLTEILIKKVNQPVKVKEIECYATGADHCRFEVTILDTPPIQKLRI